MIRHTARPGRLLMLGLTLLLGGLQNAAAQSPRFSGYMFGDYYYVAASHNPDLEERNGFWFRRIYFTFDQRVAERWSVRLRTEMSQPGDFTSSSKMTPEVKDAYVQWTNGRHTLLLGISPTPTWDRLEKAWGYRSVEKTALDLYKFGSSRDFGLAARGTLDADGRVQYHVMVANGASNGTETDKGKKVLASLAFSPVNAFTVEGYADYEDRPGRTNRATVQGAAWYSRKEGRLGVQVAHQIQQKADGGEDTFDVVSVFGVVRLQDRLHALARLDHQFQPNPRAESIAYVPFAPDAEASFIVAGLDYALTDQVHVMPNVEVVTYSNAAGATPDSDVLARFTFYYTF
ncbi:hypothetical protein AWN76_001050 [Rhodothermaceae bacterium RA]|nr:hypothetical protein AWN76_001050 [Rhodothermaceae bacterium RA]